MAQFISRYSAKALHCLVLGIVIPPRSGCYSHLAAQLPRQTEGQRLYLARFRPLSRHSASIPLSSNMAPPRRPSPFRVVRHGGRLHDTPSANSSCNPEAEGRLRPQEESPAPPTFHIHISYSCAHLPCASSQLLVHDLGLGRHSEHDLGLWRREGHVVGLRVLKEVHVDVRPQDTAANACRTPTGRGGTAVS